MLETETKHSEYTPISIEEAYELLKVEGAAFFDLLNRAHLIRMKTRGDTVNLCGIVNAKSGMCTEDCKFCAQSAHNDVNVECYSLLEKDNLVNESKIAHKNQAGRFGIVTSGLAVDEEGELNTIADAISGIEGDGDVLPCASLGNVTKETLQKLKDAGLTRYHCNLETAESFYPNICSTRPWSKSVETIKIAKELDLATCCGGLIGLGESLMQRVELLESIRDLDVDSVPLNFFNPVSGTRIDVDAPISPRECLKFIAVARLMMPYKEIRVCGGREHNFGDLQSWILISGADGLMIGGYLTTRGRAVEDDLKMIRDAGFKVEKNH